MDIKNLERLAEVIRRKNILDDEIAGIIKRPALIGHTGEYIASEIFDISLEESATAKGLDGRFTTDSLAGKTVNIKWYGKWEGLLDLSPSAPPPDYYLVVAGPKAPAVSSKGKTRPWLINYVFLFNAQELIGELKSRGIKVGIATSVRNMLWEAAELYPNQQNRELMLSVEQKRMLSIFYSM